MLDTKNNSAIYLNRAFELVDLNRIVISTDLRYPNEYNTKRN